ncbi:MAG: FKBP-type peptidyl-prolyl cis-trans isomerase [Nitrospirales bacterium]
MVCLALGMGLGVADVRAESAKGEAPQQVSAGKEVSLEYTLSLEDKTVIDTNVGAQPLVYKHGDSQIIPGLEKELEGMKVGDRKKVTVGPKDGYGEIDPKQVQEVPKNMIPADAQKVGQQLVAKGPHGESMYVRVKEVKDDTVVLDMNHPLAGKTLHFDVTVLGVK